MKKVYLFAADGFEEIEGLTVVDLLRRAGIECSIVSMTGNELITGSHGIAVRADMQFDAAAVSDGDMFVLPGGMPGTNHLMAHEGLRALLTSPQPSGRYIAAICAAPSVLGQLGLLKGKRATCYPGFEAKLTGAEAVADNVVVDGSIITSRGLGTAIDFALELVTLLADSAAAEELAASIQYHRT
ncbi:MAG: DJ-1/PfpI family protein [Lachnospiraceae bacterium]|nr:DJ-1/PfpI family protein [Lachnospiraceae bacterium]